MPNMNRLRGLRALLEDAVEHGASAVERVHLATAARPFDILGHIPPLAPAARAVRVVHDATVASVYRTIRQVNHLVGATLSVAIDLYDDARGDDGRRDPEQQSQAGRERTSDADREHAPDDGETRG
jgi:hypothetical protein